MEDTQNINDTNEVKINPINNPSFGSKKYDSDSTGENNPINLNTVASNEQSDVTNSESNITSKPGEIQTEYILENQLQPININLEKNPDTPISNPSLNNSNVNQVSNNIENTNSTSSVNVSNQNTVLKLKRSNSDNKSTSINNGENKNETSSFFSKVETIAEKVGNTLNLPKAEEIRRQTNDFFGAARENIVSNISNVKESFTKDKSTNSSINDSKSLSEEKKLSTSSEAVQTTTQSTISDENPTAFSVEQTKPSVSNEVSKINQSNQSNTNSPSSNSSTSSSIQNQSSTILTNSNSANQSNSQSNKSSSIATKNEPSTSKEIPAPIVNVDLSQLAQSITRLERILMSGIEVTIKDT